MIAVVTSNVGKSYTCQKIQFGFQVIISWCFEKEIKTFIFFIKFGRHTWGDDTSILGVEYLSLLVQFNDIVNHWQCGFSVFYARGFFSLQR